MARANSRASAVGVIDPIGKWDKSADRRFDAQADSFLRGESAGRFPRVLTIVEFYKLRTDTLPADARVEDDTVSID